MDSHFILFSKMYWGLDLNKQYTNGKKGLIPQVIGNSIILIKVKYKARHITEISASYTSRDYLEKLCDITIQGFRHMTWSWIFRRYKRGRANFKDEYRRLTAKDLSVTSKLLYEADYICALTEFYVKYLGQTTEQHSLNRVTLNG
jgi:hypothetical protein